LSSAMSTRLLRGAVDLGIASSYQGSSKSDWLFTIA
jgi:hypothetical protein